MPGRASGVRLLLLIVACTAATQITTAASSHSSKLASGEATESAVGQFYPAAETRRLQSTLSTPWGEDTCLTFRSCSTPAPQFNNTTLSLPLQRAGSSAAPATAPLPLRAAAATKPGATAVTIAPGQPVAFSSPVSSALAASIIGGLLITRGTDADLFSSPATTFTLSSPSSPASPATSGDDVVLRSLATGSYCRAGEVDAYRTALVCDAAAAAGALLLRLASSKLYYLGFPLVTGAPGQLAMFDFTGAGFHLPFSALGGLQSRCRRWRRCRLLARLPATPPACLHASRVCLQLGDLLTDVPAGCSGPGAAAAVPRAARPAPGNRRPGCPGRLHHALRPHPQDLCHRRHPGRCLWQRHHSSGQGPRLSADKRCQPRQQLGLW
jgi:hypothetical protein